MDHDGEITSEDLEKLGKIKDLESKYEKLESQRLLAWTAMISMILFTILIFSPLLDNEKLKLVIELSSMFYVAQASIVGAFMGFTTWLSRK